MLVEDLAQALALVVGEALRDAVGVGLARHHHEEAAGEAHLLGEAGALVGDRVLRDLHDDHLPVLEHPLDLGLVAALDVGLVERDVAAVEHAVLGRADVDERGLHAGQHVLHPAEVDVAVDRLVARRRGQRVLDQAAALEHRDVGVPPWSTWHAHQVAAGRAALAGAAPAAFEHVVVERRAPGPRRRRGRRARRRRRRRGCRGCRRHRHRRGAGRPAGGGAAGRRPAGAAAASAAAAPTAPLGGAAVAGAAHRARRRWRSPRRGPPAARAGVADLGLRRRGRPPRRPPGGRRRSGRACGSSPASSIATSATSSVVRPRSAAASV